MKSLKLVVYEILDDSISPIGLLQEYNSLSYSPCFDEVGSFSLTIPFSQEAFDLVSRANDKEKLIHLDDDFVGVCHKVQATQSPAKKQIKIQGTLAEGLLENSVVKTVNVYPSATKSPYNLLNIQSLITFQINANTSKTWCPAIVFESQQTDDSFVLEDGYQGGRSTYRSFIEDVCKLCNKGYKVRINSEANKLLLNLVTYTDRSLNQTKNDPVLISAKLSSLYSSDFCLNSQNYKNVVFAYAKFQYNDAEQLMESIVTYDAKPLADLPLSKIRASYDEVDIEQQDDMGLEDIQAAVRREGKQKLYDYNLIKSYECELNEEEGTFKFNQDYFLGDVVSVYDETLGIQIDAQLKEYTKTYDKNGEKFEPVFGFSQPTLNKVLKQKGVI